MQAMCLLLHKVCKLRAKNKALTPMSPNSLTFQPLIPLRLEQCFSIGQFTLFLG